MKAIGVLLLGCLAFLAFSCKGAPPAVSVRAGSPQSSASAAPQEVKPQQPPVAGTKAETATKPLEKEAAYPGQNQILAAVGLDSDSFSYARFYLATIKTPASSATKNQYEAQLLASTSNYAKGQTLWTDKVIRKTHRLAKEEIKVGLVVLYPAGTDIWSRAVVADTSDLFKDEVTLDLFWGSKPDRYDRKEKWKIQNLRVSDDPVFRPPR